MKRKFSSYILLGIINLIAITLGIYLSTFVQPQITVMAQLSQASNEEFENWKAHVMSPNREIEKFRHINLKIKITTPFALINNAHINKNPSEQYLIKSYFENNIKVETLGGSMYSNSGGKEYSEDMTIYMRDISEDELKNTIGDLRISISWQNIWNKKDCRIFYLKDYLK